jgi:hypothetical protein
MAKPLSGPPKVAPSFITPPAFFMSPIRLTLLPVLLFTDTREVFSGSVWPLGRMASRKRRLSLPLPLSAEIAEVVVGGLTLPGSASVTSPSTRVPAGKAIEPLLALTESTSVAEKRSPALDVLVESGVSNVARISVFAGICSSGSLIGESGRAYVAEDDDEDGEAAGPLFIAGFEFPKLLGVAADEELAGEVAGAAPLDDGSELAAGAPLTRDDGGTGSVDAAGFVALAGEAVLSCAGTCVWGGLTGEKELPFWPNTSAPVSKTNTTCPENLRTLTASVTSSLCEKQMISRRLALTTQLFIAIQHLST